MPRTNYVKRSLITLACMALVVPILVWGLLGSLSNVNNAPFTWLPPSFKARADYTDFIIKFQTVETVAVSWPGCTVDDPRLDRLADELRSDRVTEAGSQYKEFIKEVVTVETLLNLMAADRQDKTSAKVESGIKSRLRGSLIGQDGESTCALVVMTIKGSQNPETTIGILRDVAVSHVGIAPNELRLTGSMIDGISIDNESNRALTYYALPSMLLSILICRVCLRSWILTAAIVAVASFGAGGVLALVYLLGAQMNAVVMVMAPLLFVLTLSGGVHLVNYYHDECSLRGIGGAAGRALRVGWQPCALAAATTAIGLASLMVSDVTPVWDFGMISTIGVLITLVLLLLVAPGAMQFYGRYCSKIGKPIDRAPDHSQQSSGAFLEFICRMYGSYWAVITAAFIGSIVFAIFGLPRLTTSVSVTDLLSRRSKTIHDYQWMEERLGPLIPVEVLITFEQDCPLNTLEQVELVRGVEHRIQNDVGLRMDRVDDEIIISKVMVGGFALEQGRIKPGDRLVSLSTSETGEMYALKGANVAALNRLLDTGSYDTLRLGIIPAGENEVTIHPFSHRRSGALSVSTFVPEISAGGIRQAAERGVIKVYVEKQIPLFKAANLVYDEPDGNQVWRITARAPALGNVDYGQLVDRLQLRVDDFLGMYETHGVSGISAKYTGLTPVIFHVQQALLDDLMTSFLSATGLVMLVMILVMRNIPGGIIVMLPNIFPAALLFGSMAWFRQPVDIGTVMTASVALGIAVDDTLHFLAWFRRELDVGNTPDVAVKNTMKHCAVAMIQTTAICGIAMLVLSLSGFVPTQRFGLMMFALLALALVGDLILLPAMLIGPIGKIFIRRHVAEQSIKLQPTKARVGSKQTV